MRYLSVCSGIEAASVAWESLGWTPVAFAEIERFPSQVLAHHFPGVPNLGDMTKYKDWNIDRDAVDLIVGGTPCQSFSVAGLRKGLEDPRGNLALTFIGMVDHYRPEWVIWENVPGVLSSSGGRDFGSFLGALGQLGYGFAYRVLDAQYFGVPQRRRRVFVVAHSSGDSRRAAEILFEPESLRGNHKTSRTQGQGIADASITGSVSSKWAKGTGGPSGDECYNLVQVAQAFNHQSGGDMRGIDPRPTAQLQRHQETSILQGMAVRRLTPTECERLQGFPDGWTDILSTTPDGPRYKALGNSMAVPVMRWIGSRIQACR
jgi:DNA (cytosine-5)-methyltransferase 1